MHPHDNGRDRLRKLVAQAKSAGPSLPLVYSTDAYGLDDALSATVIEPTDNSVFTGESLICTFYGRPSSKPLANEVPASLGHYLPVCLIFMRSFAEEIRRVFPFNTWAYDNDFYRSFLHGNMRMADFALEPHLDTPGRVVSTFFGTARSYLQARPNLKIDFDPAQFEARSFAALIDAEKSNAMDSRGTGIEVQLADPISMADWVEAAVVPSAFAESSIGAELRRLGVEILPYNVTTHMGPDEYASSVADLCLHYYARQGLLEEVLP
ncbi:hypothetical protein LZK82_09910 [Rhizobium leguminosarum]|nr:hypothetical protein LZK82_09910 [Rhizobium leguminosarum]UIL29546.1 hypothetical protein LZK75_10070 [Rhizobium leguminosarum]